MRLILDTHILLWTLAESERLPQRARDLLIDPANEKLASVVSLWEVAIKTASRRAKGDPMPFDVARMRELVGDAGLHIVSVDADHVAALATLQLDRHRDPFDRMLVAQAIAESAALLTMDAALSSYGASVLVV